MTGHKTDGWFDWSDEAIETLKRLWRDGVSAGQIAKRLGNPSRSSVIGKIHRLGLSQAGRAMPAKPLKAPPVARAPSQGNGLNFKAHAAPKPAKPALHIAGNGAVYEQSDAAPVLPPVPAKAWTPLPGTTPVRLVDRAPFTCRWPIDWPGEDVARFCGCVAPTDRYCEVHSRASIQKDRSDAAKAADAARREKMRARFLKARAAA